VNGPSPEPSWPIPPPDQAPEVAEAHVSRLARTGALDEGTPYVLDRLINTWVDHWLKWAADAKDKRRSQARSQLIAAQSSRDFVDRLLLAAYQKLLLSRNDVIASGLASPPEVSYEELRSGSLEVPVMTAPDARPQADGKPPPAVLLPPKLRFLALAWRWVTTGLLPWVLLSIMAGGDAYGFWQVLVVRFARDTNLTKYLVVAIAVASVAAADYIGRLVRRYRDGLSPRVRPWIAFVATAWTCLGITIFWLRAHPPATVGGTSAGQSTGVFTNPSATPIAGGAANPTDWGVAALLLLLYLMTGAIAITHAFHASDPSEGHRRSAIANWNDAQRSVADNLYHYKLAARRAEEAERALQRVEADTSHEDECRSAGEAVKQRARLILAHHLKSPPGTEAVMGADPQPYTPVHRPPDSTPPEAPATPGPDRRTWTPQPLQTTTSSGPSPRRRPSFPDSSPEADTVGSSGTWDTASSSATGQNTRRPPAVPRSWPPAAADAAPPTTVPPPVFAAPPLPTVFAPTGGPPPAWPDERNGRHERQESNGREHDGATDRASERRQASTEGRREPTLREGDALSPEVQPRIVSPNNDAPPREPHQDRR
jgi:hypothetical protein